MFYYIDTYIYTHIVFLGRGTPHVAFDSGSKILKSVLLNSSCTTGLALLLESLQRQMALAQGWD